MHSGHYSPALDKPTTVTLAQVLRIILLALVLVSASGFSPTGIQTRQVVRLTTVPASSSLSQDTAASPTASGPVPLETANSSAYSAAQPTTDFVREEKTDQPTTQAQSYQVSQPQDYPEGLYQAYLTARQNEGGTQYEVQSGTGDDLATSITATNPAQQLASRFTNKGVSINGLNLELSRVGYAGQPETDLELDKGVAPVAVGNRIIYQSAPSLSQWYLNGPLGLEQGFTLEKPLPGSSAQTQTLEFELKLSGLKQASLSSKGDSVHLSLAGGRQLDYGQLYVYDAVGKVLPTYLELTALGEGEGDYNLAIVVEEVSGAKYPLTIDPLFVQSQLLSDTTSGAVADHFGSSVALSSDGNTALIGASGKNVAYIFTRTKVGSNYFQSQILSDTTSAGGDFFGSSVALTSDGNTALIGAFAKKIGANGPQGATYIFTRNGMGSNYFQSQILSDTITGVAYDAFGFSVALSSDGNTALVGAYNKTIGGHSYQGAAYIFTRSTASSNYSQSQILSDTTTGAANDYFGISVALSADGNTALIGSMSKKIDASLNQGAAYIFTRSGVGLLYSQFQFLSDTNSGAAADYFGYSVALSSDGNTALIGAEGKKIGGNTVQGAAYIFNRNAVGSLYSQSQILSDTVSGASGDYFGYSVALSSDGNTALIGAYNKKLGGNGLQGAAYIFNRSAVGSLYSQSQFLSDTTTGAANDDFGYSVALSSDGNTALIGAYTKTIGGNSLQGAAYSFIRQLPSSNVSLAASASSITFGQSLSVTATVTPLTATGTLTFNFDNGNALITQTISSSSASYLTSTLPVGQHSIVAIYSGDSNLVGSTSAPVTVTVLALCDPLQVTSSLDDGSCGTLRQAVQAAASGPTKTITINLAAGSVITLTSGLTLTTGIAITTTAPCSGSGPSITLRGSGINSGNGLVMSNNNSLYGLWIRGFSGRQIVAPTSSHSLLKCVRTTRS